MTGGKQMDGFARTIEDLVSRTGVARKWIFTQTAKELPGYFRATKQWDVLVVVEGVFLAGIELKSQVGPSFGNNANNRVEEALGSSVDLWTAYREGAFQTSPRPWLGYLFLLEDTAASRSPVAIKAPHFGAFREFQGGSYQTRYELLCERLVRERHYDGACLLISDRAVASRHLNYEEPIPALGATPFLTQLLTHIAANRP